MINAIIIFHTKVNEREFGKKIVSILLNLLPTKDFTPLHEPYFQGNELSYVKDCVESTFVSSVGAYVDRFERDLAEYTGARRAVAVINGTSALQIALQLAGVESGDEVVVPALSFVATANAARYISVRFHISRIVMRRAWGSILSPYANGSIRRPSEFLMVVVTALLDDVSALWYLCILLGILAIWMA